MKQRCQACGVEKDTEAKEIYRYPDDGVVDDRPIDPFFGLHCQGPVDDGITDWRVATVCHDCFHKLEPDMWISDDRWKALNPIVAFEKLPKLHAKPQA